MKERIIKVIIVISVVPMVLGFTAHLARAQGPVEEFIEPFTMPEQVVEQGTPYEALHEPFAARMLAELGPCDYLPRFVDNRGETDVMPPGFPESGDIAEVLEWSGIIIDREHGCERAREGETYLSIEALELKCGDAAIQARVDEDGVPLEGVLLWFSWPNMGDADQMPAWPQCLETGTCVGPRYKEE